MPFGTVARQDVQFHAPLITGCSSKVLINNGTFLWRNFFTEDQGLR